MTTTATAHHDPTFLRHEQYAWWQCTCGATGRAQIGHVGAQLDYGHHLLTTKDGR